jgi:HEAT repeat protein
MTMGAIFEKLRDERPDIEILSRKKDVNGLILALRDPDIGTQWMAAEALRQLGPVALEPLVAGLRTWDKQVRLGIIEALGQTGNIRAVPHLIPLLSDRDAEIRWETALALGEIGDPVSSTQLVVLLGDPDKYVRYGAALALDRIGWVPRTPAEEALRLLGLQDFKEMIRIGVPAIEALGIALKDPHPEVRIGAVDTLGAIGNPAAIPDLYTALKDPDDEVRWHAVLAGPRCGIDLLYLPRGLAKRPRIRKNHSVAGLLNLLLPGLGYFYIGKWWGILIFQVDVYVTLWLASNEGLEIAYYLFLIYIALAIHGWWMARKLPDL